MTTITNETIIKAAKAAGLDVREKMHNGALMPMLFSPNGGATFFFPQNNDIDNAMIMDGAEVCICYIHDTVKAECFFELRGDMEYETVDFDIDKNNKPQARRDAVILCAAAKLDAMNGEDHAK